MGQIHEQCANCKSYDLVLQRDAGWVTGSWRHLRCKSCGNNVRLIVPGWTIALYVVAAVAVIWTVFSVSS